MKLTRSAFGTVPTAPAVPTLAAAIAAAVRGTLDAGRGYSLSRQFLDELPQRRTGTGRPRFPFQPRVAMLPGFRSGVRDSRPGHPPYRIGLLMGGPECKEVLRSRLAAVRDLVAVGIVPDAVVQFLIGGRVHPGAAPVIGPVLVCLSNAATPGSIAGACLTGLRSPFKPMAHPDDGIQWLAQGAAQAAVPNSATLQYLPAKPGKGVRQVVGPVFRPCRIGVVVREGSPLREADQRGAAGDPRERDP
jgi:hypothetical protein